MSHFTVLVITKPDQDPETLLAPYDENVEVAPHYEDCYCKTSNLRSEVNRRLEEHFAGDFNTAFRKPYNELPESNRPNWKKHIKPWVDLENKLTKQLKKEFVKPDPKCQECKGTGRYLSRYNPSSKWDWHEMGGRWTGYMTLKYESMGRVGTPGLMTDPAPDGTADQAKVKDIDLTKLKRPFAFITPDGVWHEKAEMWWFAITTNERPRAYARQWHELLASLEPDDTLTLFDCHI